MSDHENKVREATKAVMAQHDNTLRRPADAPASAGPPDARERRTAITRAALILAQDGNLHAFDAALDAALAAPSPSAGSEREALFYDRDWSSDRKPFVSSIAVRVTGHHAKLTIWNRGACAGMLCVNADDAELFINALIPRGRQARGGES